MTVIALFGAGGKMGYRLASNLKGSRFQVRHVEVAPPGLARLKSSLGYCSQGACLKIAVKGRKVCLHHLTYMREYKATRRAS